MSNDVNLKELERRAFRFTFEDGIWDIYLGLLLLVMSVMPWVVETYLPLNVVIIIGLSVVVIALCIFYYGKKKITVPRLGLIKFGAARKRRLEKVRVILFLSALLGIVLLISTKFMGLIANVPSVVLIYSANAIVVFSLGAYFLNFQRLYLYGIFFALPFPLAILLLNHGVTTLLVIVICSIPALIMLTIGLMSFVGFVLKYPKPVEEFLHGS